MSTKETNAMKNGSSSPYNLHRLTFLNNAKWQEFVAGTAGGVVATVALHPLDLLKVRFQVNEGTGVIVRPQYASIWDGLKKIYHLGGGIRALYQGLTPNVCGAGSAWGIYFLLYGAMKTHQQEKIARKSGSETLPSLTAIQNMSNAALCGAMTLTVTNPIFVSKTRLFLQYENMFSEQMKSSQSGYQKPSHITQYRGMIHTLYSIAREEGVRGLYKGMVPGLLGVSHGAVQFMAYEEMKKGYCTYFELAPNSKLGVPEYLTFAGLSKLVAAAATYPYQVVRSRLQDQHRQYNGVLDCILQTWRFEGIRGFYKGLGISLIRVVPASCITFVVHEKASAWLHGATS